jgi:hypothetical protein
MQRKTFFCRRFALIGAVNNPALAKTALGRSTLSLVTTGYRSTEVKSIMVSGLFPDYCSYLAIGAAARKGKDEWLERERAFTEVWEL